MSGFNQPCGCQDQMSVDVGQLASGATEIPSLAEFEQKLAEISSSSGAGTSVSELDLAGLEASLDAVEELSLDLECGEEVPSLHDLLYLLERYPGLKLSLSY